MALHEFITCDRCNEDGDINPELIGSLDDGAQSQISGNADHAIANGWSVDEGAAFDEHVCPACQADDMPSDE
jgi:hypothetical protein